MNRWLLSLALLLTTSSTFLCAQAVPSTSANSVDQLRFVVYLSRHGVRSPTSRPQQFNNYSTAPWPSWDVPPGYLTAHGYHLMELFGAYDRLLLAQQGLLSATGCADAGQVRIVADSDQRTRETGNAIAAGLMPGCGLSARALPEGTNDPLFHFHPGKSADPALAVAAIAGRIGGDPGNLTAAYRAQLTALDTILATCGSAQAQHQTRVSLFDIPATLSAGNGDHLAELHGPLSTAATLTENLLLEYTQGMDAANVGWGCVDGAKLRSLMELHTSAADITERTPEIARVQASNLLDQILRAMQQAVTTKPVVGAPDKPADRVLFLVGHDTNITNVAGVLNLTWIEDGHRDDTPPGGALVFELWHNRKTGRDSVRTYFTVQTLEQMRSGAALTLDQPPLRIPVFIPGCSQADLSCAWPAFAQTIQQRIGPRYRLAAK